MPVQIHVRRVGRRRIRSDELLTVDHKKVRGADYSGRKLTSFTSLGSRFESCRFEDMRIEDAGLGAGMEMSGYTDCGFDRTRIDHATGHARFVRCSFRDVDIRYWIAASSEFVDCVFSGRVSAGFRGTIPNAETRQYLRRERNEFHGNDFSEADLVECDFMGGIDLTQQRLPTGGDYLYLADGPTVLRRLHEEVEAWEEGPVQRRAIAFVKSLEVFVGTGQQQLFLRESDVDDAGHLFQLLRGFAAEA